MKHRPFGRTGWQVSDVGYGMWGMGAWSGSEDNESLDSLQSAIDLACNFFDSAWVYGDSRSEKLLGRILRANSAKKLYVASKVPPKNRTSARRGQFHGRRLLSARPHHRIHREKPQESRPRNS